MLAVRHKSEAIFMLRTFIAGPCLASLLFGALFLLETTDSRAGEISPPTEEPIVLSCYLDPQSSLFAQIEQWYLEVFRRVGRTVELRHFPIVRGAVEVEEGRVDGTFYRITEFGELHPHLIRVEEPLSEVGVVAYAIDHRFDGISMEALKNWEGAPLKIGYARGILAARLLVESGLEREHELYPVVDQHRALHMLAEGRVDLMIGTRKLVQSALKDEPDWRSAIHEAAVLDNNTGYIYLNERCAELAPRLAAAIRTFKREVPLDRVVQKVLTP